jgi:Integral membrane protein TerC family
VLALIMRAIFIALGATLLSLFSFMFLVFGLLLIYTAVQLFRHRNEAPDVEDNAVVHGARRVLSITTEYVDGRIITKVDGRCVLTPLFVVLVVPGHGPVGRRADLVEYRDMLVGIRNRVADLKRRGLTVDQTIAAKPTQPFDAKWGQGVIGPDLFTTLVYRGV